MDISMNANAWDDDCLGQIADGISVVFCPCCGMPTAVVDATGPDIIQYGLHLDELIGEGDDE